MQVDQLKRREFITLLGGTVAAWPLAAHAQQSGMPVIGFMNIASAEALTHRLTAFRQGLNATGYTADQNVKIEFRLAEGHYDRLPAMAADLVQRQVTVIAATSTAAALAAKAATAVIPIVFETASDPIRLGLVGSLKRPGGNVTGVTQLNVEIAPKLLELLHELVPTARVMALLVNPTDPALAEPQSRAMLSAASKFGLELHVLNASSEDDFDAVFESLTRLRAGGLVISADAFFLRGIERLAALTLRHAVPAITQYREFAAAGGLISYGSDNRESYRLAGIYTGRVLKGEKPADLPVQQATKVELFINLKTAKTLGITVPLPLSGRADEVE
jgi:putative tryptophan/tyrosine transport system substrate-binding protein